MDLSNSTRSLPKATYVRLDVPTFRGSDTGRALQKASFLRSLKLQDGEVESALKLNSKDSRRLSSGAQKKGLPPRTSAPEHTDQDQGHGDFETVLRSFEGAKQPSQTPSPAAVAEIPADRLLNFGKQLAVLRESELDRAKTQPHHHAAKANLSARLDRLHAAMAAFSSVLTATPLGMMNLERLDMTPAGLEKGELIATIPLAPQEKTNVIQQEWSTISQEFTSIVTDSLEDFSETGVEENTELAQATTSQNSHANQFNVTASASGGCGFVTGSASTTFGSQDQSSTSATDSRKHAETITKKASSRVKQSHKVTISTNTTSGSSTSTTRVLQNPSDTDPMRIDYFSMMRKWHVGLYRYGLRLTYDLTVPEPGATMRQIYADIEAVQTGLAQNFKFDLSPNDITSDSGPGNYADLAAKYGVKSVPRPPDSDVILQVSDNIPNLKADHDSSWIQNEFTFNVRDGYEINFITLTLILSGFDLDVRVFRITGCKVNTNVVGQGQDEIADVNLGDYLQGQTGTVKVVYFAQYYGNGSYAFTIHQKPTAATMDTWRNTVYQALYDAVLSDFTAEQARLQAELQKLMDQISGIDTLTLRREENDEIMKCVLRWLLGPSFQFVSQSVSDVFDTTSDETTGDKDHGIHFSENEQISDASWSTMSAYGKLVTFINEAIEWENVVYFLYSYFWDDPKAWKFIRNLQHPDPTRQAFLRSGSARVVLTIRKGFEKAWVWFAEYGRLDDMPEDVSNYPYLSIAQQIENYDNTNYPGIPPANPTGTANIGGQYAGTMAISQVAPGDDVAIRVKDTQGFAVGNTLVIDTFASGVQERQKIVKVFKEKNILVVEELENKHGTDNNHHFPVYQSGEEGLLIAEWFEYTPSHGTMISVNSSLNDMA